jgi:hypothetical protein
LQSEGNVCLSSPVKMREAEVTTANTRGPVTGQ